jgi:hypothetical protein
VPCERRLSKNVGTVVVPDTVPSVRSTGPKPMMPSTPEKPVDVDATPIDCDVTVRPANETWPEIESARDHASQCGARTVSVYSVPLNEPEP